MTGLEGEAGSERSKPTPLGADGDCAGRLKTLADPSRLALLGLLSSGPRTAGALSTALGMPPNLGSHHLKVLRENGLVAAERQGKSVLYRLTERVSVATGDGHRIDLGCCSLDFR